MPVADIAIDTKPPVAFGLAWRDRGPKTTPKGPRHLYEAAPTEAFSAAWRAQKEALRDTGFGFSPPRGRGDWTVCFWARPSAEALQAAAVATAAEVEASRATDADVQIPAPEGMAYLPYQRGGIAYCMARPAALIGDEMGLGKTIQAIGVINASGAKRVLIACPASLKVNWMRELAKWLVEALPVHVIDGGKRSLPDVSQGGVVVINYDVMHSYTDAIRAVDWDLFVGDEAHMLKSKKARRTRAVFGGAATKTAPAVTPIAARRKLLLTGTPMSNRPAELHPLLAFLDKATWGDFFPFGVRYCGGHRTRFGWDFDGATNLPELQERLRASVMVRRLKEDVLAELPAKIRQVVPLEAGTVALRRLLSDEQAAHEAWEALASAGAASRAAAFAELSKAREKVGLAKAPLVAEHILHGEGPVVVFAHHKAVIDILSAALTEAGRVVVRVTGDMDAAERQASVDAFQQDRADVIIGTYGAMGVGHTLVRSSHVVCAEMDWVPATMSQAEDRCHRIGQRGSVHVEHLVFEGSLDSRLVDVVLGKQAVLDASLDSPAPVSGNADSAPTTAPTLAEVAPALDDDAIAEIEAAAVAAVAEKAEAAEARRREREDREARQRTEDAMTVPDILAALRAALATQGWALGASTYATAAALAEREDLAGYECSHAFELIARMRDNADAAAERVRAATVEDGDLARAADPEVRAIALGECRRLSGLDADHAAEDNGVGWSKSTSSLGHSLAAQDALDEHDAAVALGVLRVHSRQLDSLVRERLFDDMPATPATPAPEAVAVPAPEVVEVTEPPVPAEPEPTPEPVPAATPTAAQERLRRAGELVYGPRWQTDLARDLGIADRSVRRYATGAVPVPDDLWPRIVQVIRDRRAAMDAFLGETGGEPAPAAEPAPPPPAEPVRRNPDLPAPGVAVVDYVADRVRALTADRQRRETAQWQLMSAAERAYLTEHWHEVQILGHGVSGVVMLVADHDAELDVIDRVAAIVASSADAVVAAGKKPAWLSAAQADAAIEQAGGAP